ncbi:hypothetical protein MKA27_13290 [[Clostridium] innocuum]|uniref:hypothetical protein n=1 Tax=Clostridium innocuum TaxID=1522 RepID=UPI000D6D0796|nr:hypothetical protein [[Clostridium] innocuum]MCR0315284.1 hypothetical protein [[Clostridium] innocuum]MCR0369694.1 hypothetical protein [[Clostridium] innocuum]MCR0374794.1 hypothetical protein [[Clostridium] innocuum]MCR0559647.1 hypothetical protein [[Clostridium] innocuum]MCR0602659.1 hypothetical protein [[Clostridium] innocuum]
MINFSKGVVNVCYLNVEKYLDDNAIEALAKESVLSFLKTNSVGIENLDKGAPYGALFYEICDILKKRDVSLEKMYREILHDTYSIKLYD